MIALDAGALIAFFEPSAAHNAAATDAIAGTTEPLCASTLTLAELLVGVVAGDRLRLTLEGLEALEVREVPVGPGSALRLAALRRETRLTLPDCCVLLAAEDAGASGLLTFDERMTAVARGRGLAVP